MVVNEWTIRQRTSMCNCGVSENAPYSVASYSAFSCGLGIVGRNDIEA